MKTMKKRIIGLVLAFTLMAGCCIPSAFAGSVDSEDILLPSVSGSGSTPGISQAQDAFFDTAMDNIDHAQIDLTEPLQSLFGALGLNITVQRASTSVSYVDQQLSLVIDSSLLYRARPISDTITLSAQKNVTGDWTMLSCSDTSGVISTLWIILKMAQS